MNIQSKNLKLLSWRVDLLNIICLQVDYTYSHLDPNRLLQEIFSLRKVSRGNLGKMLKNNQEAQGINLCSRIKVGTTKLYQQKLLRLECLAWLFIKKGREKLGDAFISVLGQIIDGDLQLTKGQQQRHLKVASLGIMKDWRTVLAVSESTRLSLKRCKVQIPRWASKQVGWKYFCWFRGWVVWLVVVLLLFFFSPN